MPRRAADLDEALKKKGGLTLSQLANYDDLLTDTLVDRVYFWSVIRKLKPSYHACRGVQEAEVCKILQEEVIINKDTQAAHQKILQLSGVQRFYKALKTDDEREHFERHLRKYLCIYLPDCPFEVGTTNRYTIMTAEAAIIARTTIRKGEPIKYLSGIQVEMSEKEEKELSSRTDFSIVLSSRRKRPSLFLGPARFANHDCNSNARLNTSGPHGIHIVACRDISPGDEITVTYGDDYFGEDNCECLCGTCENLRRNGWDPKGPQTKSNVSTPETSSNKKRKRTPDDNDPESDRDIKRSCELVDHEVATKEPIPFEEKIEANLLEARSRFAQFPLSGPLMKRVMDISESVERVAQAQSLSEPNSVAELVTSTVSHRAPQLLNSPSRDRLQSSLRNVTAVGDDDMTIYSVPPSPPVEVPVKRGRGRPKKVQKAPNKPSTTSYTSLSPNGTDSSSSNSLASTRTSLDIFSAGNIAENIYKMLSPEVDPDDTLGIGISSVTPLQLLSPARSETTTRRSRRFSPHQPTTQPHSAAVHSIETPREDDDHDPQDRRDDQVRVPGDYHLCRALLTSADHRWVECRNCDEWFVQSDAYQTRIACPRCERHSKLYGYHWPKTDRAGKMDREERVLDHRTIHRFIDAEEERSEKKGRKSLGQVLKTRADSLKRHESEESLGLGVGSNPSTENKGPRGRLLRRSSRSRSESDLRRPMAIRTTM